MLYGGQIDFDKTVVPFLHLALYRVVSGDASRRHDVQHPRASDFLVRRKRLYPVVDPLGELFVLPKRA